MWRGAVTACFWLSQTRHIASANLLGALPYTPVLEPPTEGAAKVFPTPVRQQIILRSDNLRSDDFGALFSRFFGNRYSDNPRRCRRTSLSVAFTGGTMASVSGGCITTVISAFRFPDPQDEITFVIPTAGKIVFNHATESIGMTHVGLAVDKADIRSMRFVDDHAHHGMSINRHQLTERLSMLLDKPILQKIVFAPSVDLNTAAFQGIRALIDLATGTEFDSVAQQWDVDAVAVARDVG
jgi:hypothetical protein